VFGRVGDLVGRKNTFLVTMAIMGLSTFLVGLLPSYASIGVGAPILLVTLRLLQGLALGGEYGGRRSTSPNTRQKESAVCTRVSSRRRRQSGFSPPSSW